MACDVTANGITFCTGSLGIRPTTIRHDSAVRRERIHFIHLRTTKRETDPRNFHEADHLAGDVDVCQSQKKKWCQTQNGGQRQAPGGTSCSDAP